jgi:hypothetical protein
MLTYAQNLSAECSDLRASLQSASEKASFQASAAERAEDENNLLRKEVDRVTRELQVWVSVCVCVCVCVCVQRGEHVPSELQTAKATQADVC